MANLAKEWKEVTEGLSQLNQLSINRLYLNKFDPISIEVRVFSDVSVKVQLFIFVHTIILPL